MTRESSGSAAAEGLRVLIVEDDLDCAESIATLLRLFGHTAATAGNGLAAVAAVVANQFDVVLLDIGLPGMTGFDIAHWLRRQSTLNPPYLIAITGRADEPARLKAAECGIDMFLVKPVDPRKLKDLLEGL